MTNSATLSHKTPPYSHHPLFPAINTDERRINPRLRVEYSRTRLVPLQRPDDSGVGIDRLLNPSTIILPTSIQRKGDDVRKGILNEMVSFCKSKSSLCSTASSCVHEYEHYAGSARRIFLIVRNDGRMRRRRTTRHRPVFPSLCISFSSWSSSRTGDPSSTRLRTSTESGTRRWSWTGTATVCVASVAPTWKILSAPTTSRSWRT